MSADGSVVGVLAFQGDVREHVQILRHTGIEAIPVRRPVELDSVDALVIPGGESTTIVKLADAFDLLDPIRKRLQEGMPALGTCAGMILLADRILDGTSDQGTFGGLDVLVRRNAFGRQVDSFEGEVEFPDFDSPVHAVFIRAPWVEEVGDEVDVLARVASGPAAGRIVAVRQGRLMATSFHPEISGDPRVHRYFVEQVLGTAPTRSAADLPATHHDEEG